MNKVEVCQRPFTGSLKPLLIGKSILVGAMELKMSNSSWVFSWIMVVLMSRIVYTLDKSSWSVQKSSTVGVSTRVIAFSGEEDDYLGGEGSRSDSLAFSVGFPCCSFVSSERGFCY